MNALSKYFPEQSDDALVPGLSPPMFRPTFDGLSSFSQPLSAIAPDLCQSQKFSLANKMIETAERVETYRARSVLDSHRAWADAAVQRSRIEADRDVRLAEIRETEETKRVTENVFGSIVATAIQCCMAPNPNRQSMSVTEHDEQTGGWFRPVGRRRTVVVSCYP